MKIQFKQLPRGWQYVVSRHQITDAVASASERIHVIEFSGTAFKPSTSTGSCTAGECDAHYVGPDLCFRLRFYGLPENALALAADDLSPKIIAGVCEFLFEDAGNVTTPGRGGRRTLFLRITDGVLVPSFKTETLSGFWETLEESNPWW